MRSTVLLVAALLTIVMVAPTAAQSTDIDLKASDGVTLKATYTSPGRPGPATARTSIVNRSSLPLPGSTQVGSTPSTSPTASRNSSANGCGYRRSRSASRWRSTSTARGLGGYGFSFVLSLMTRVPGAGCRPGT